MDPLSCSSLKYSNDYFLKVKKIIKFSTMWKKVAHKSTTWYEFQQKLFTEPSSLSYRSRIYPLNYIIENDQQCQSFFEFDCWYIF